MTHRVTKRGIAAGAATALAIGTLTIFGTSVANAAPVVRDWADGKTSFNRTISNGTPGVGETITVTTKFRRTDNITETIAWITDVNPPCLTYVPGSAKMNGNPITPVVNPNRGGTPPTGTVTVNGSWANAPGTNNPAYSVDYKVGANCALGTSLVTGMDYSGDRGAGYYGYDGPNITAGKGNPATTLAPVTGARVGQSTSLTASVTGGGSAAGNPVEFYDGATKIGQGNLDAAGAVAFAWTPSTAGGHALTAKFLGTATANQSVSVVQNVSVSPADVTTTTSVTGPATAVAGTDVTLNVQVSPVPSGGTVQFKDGATNIGGPVTLDAQGKGSITQQFAAAGARSITAVYSGAGEFQPSTSGAHNVNVTPADVTTTTSVSGPATAVEGTDVVLGVQVSPVPVGGTVQFKNGAADIGGPVNLDSEGKGSITQQFTSVGAQSITAVYSGAGEFQPSTSGAHNVNVTPADVTTTTSVSGPATAVEGTDVVLGVQVSPVPVGGTVQFKSGAADIGGPVTLDSEGKGSITQQFTSVGAQSITAVYSGAAGFVGSTSGVHDIAITPADVTTTTSVTGPATAVAGADVTLNVQVSPVPSGGTVQFKDGATDLGGPVTLDAEGKGSITQQFAAAVARSITAVYSGAGEFQPSTSAAHNVAVTPANVATETTVTGDTAGVVGSDVSLSVKVSPAPAVGAKVQFKNGAADLGAPVDLDAQGNASITAPLAAGNHVITAVFAGFNEHQGSTSAAHNVTVTPADVTTTTSVTGPATAIEGADVVLNVQVSPVPNGGTVQFKNGANNIGGPVTLDSEGKGSITQQFATTGAQSITAVYSGAAGFITSTSDAHTVTVSAPAETDVATTTVLTVPATATKGAAVNLVATVSPDPAGGTVQFMDGTTPIGAPVGLMNGKATRSHPFATAGAHEITAIYSGAPGYLTSTAEVATVTVDEPVDGGTGSAGGSLGSLFGSS